MIKTIPAYRPIPSASDSPDSSPEKKAEHHRLSSQGGGGPSHHHPHRPPNPHNLQHRQLQQRERHELQQRRETGTVVIRLLQPKFKFPARIEMAFFFQKLSWSN